MHLEVVSNGLGAPSMLLYHMMVNGELPATVSITADTGGEHDRVRSDGKRCTAQQFFDDCVLTLATKDRSALFVRSKDKNGDYLPNLRQRLIDDSFTGKPTHIPLFGSEGGRLLQSCTDKWKIRAIRQAGRNLGAKTMRTFQGLHFHEAARRIKGEYIGVIDGWDTYRTPSGKRGRFILWCTHAYPLVELKLSREAIYDECKRRGVLYFTSSECDFCPHKDKARWNRSSPETIAFCAEIESRYNGQYFFTSKRIPLLMALEVMNREPIRENELDLDFGCTNHDCGV